MSSGLFKMLPISDSFTSHTYLMYMYKQDLSLNNFHGFICHKLKQTNIWLGRVTSLQGIESVYSKSL